MAEIKIAVISDIHAGLGARAKDLCPEPPIVDRTDLAKYNRKIDDGYLNKFVGFLIENDIKADHFLLSGDLTHSAQPNEIDIVSNLITSISDALEVDNNKVIFVPGNHDVNWEILKLHDTTGIYWDNRYLPFHDARFRFSGILGCSDTDIGGNVFENPFFSAWSHDDLLIVGYNSANHDDPEHAEHYGLIDPSHIQELREYLDSIEIPDDKICVFLVHHHPVSYSDPTPTIPDFSGMVNADELVSLLLSHSFDFLIHGHKHWPRFETYSIGGAKPICILCAGSFSVTLDSRWSGAIKNQFHLITIEERDTMVKGHVKSWSYDHLRGWENSDKRASGITHIEPFGNYLLPDPLRTRLMPIITGRLEGCDYLEWKQITEDAPELRHMRTDQIIQALDSMATSLNYERMYDTPETIILLKRI